MATYAVGDIQGCYSSLRRLLDQCRFDPGSDRLWVVGDLVNRGPESLQTLRFLYGLGPALTAVLGNHDLYLLMVAAGRMRRGSDDTLEAVLRAPDREILLDWLVRLPLMHVDGEYVMLHAGLLPQWSVGQALGLAQEVCSILQGENSQVFLQSLAGNLPDTWVENLEGIERLRVIVNAMTRLRFCSVEGVMALRAKGPPDSAPEGTHPWFRVPGRKSVTHTIVCGHWSALGYYCGNHVLALDTGCVWGGKLTAVRLEDGAIFQVPGV